MREVDTDALGQVAASLGVAAPSTATRPVTFDDDNLQQVLQVNDLVRRARNGVSTTEGLIVLQQINTHPGAGQLFPTLDPYALEGGVSAQPPWPRSMDGYDAWLLGADGVQTAGTTGNFTGAFVQITNIPVATTLATTAGRMVAAYLASVAFAMFGNFLSAQVGSFVIPTFSPVRIPRGSQIMVASTAGGAITLRFDLLIGIFPRGMGQDAVGTD